MNEEWIDGYEVLFEKERYVGLYKILETLNPRERQTLQERYFHKLTYAQIGKNLRICPQRASQIIQTALRRCRHRFRFEIFKEYGAGRGERALANWRASQEVLKKESIERQRLWEIKRDEREKEAHQKYLQEMARRQEEHDRYCEYKRKSAEQRTAVLLQSRNDVIQYYADQHKKQAIPPDYVGLIKKKNGQYVLGAQKGWDGPLFPIDISNDPITYHKWLQYLIKKKE